MVKIDRSQVLKSARWSSKGKNHKTVIVIHETANTSRGAGAYAHHRLQYNGNPRQASWHYQVDDKVAVQTFSENLRLWHSGTVAIPFTIAVELCVNEDSDFRKAIQNLIDLLVDIGTRNNIEINNQVTHYFYTKKNCPTRILSGQYGWTYESVVNEVDKRMNGKTKNKVIKQPKKTRKTTSQLVKEVERGLHGNGADRMKSLGHRYEEVQNAINKKYGVDTSTPKRVNNKTNLQLAKEIERGLHGNGHLNRQESLNVSNTRYQKIRSIVNQRAS